MKKSAKLLRPSDAYLISFIVPLLVMIAIFIVRGIFPFGSESFLRTDMYHQYAPFFSEFQYKLQHGGSLLYSWDVGLGINFAALYSYYLASPLNYLIILCPKANVIEFMTYMIVFKMALSGLTMTVYLRRHFGRVTFGACFFAIFYALSGYVSAYSWNIMWLDCIALFPLVILGAEQIIQDRSPMLYVITLGCSILSNYYISIMTCFFLVIYFVCQLLLSENNLRQLSFYKRLFRFGLYSLLSGGLAAVTLLPEIYALKGTASADSTFPKTFEQYFTILDMFARHMAGVQTEQGLDHWPNIYCGVAVFLLLPLYVMCRKIDIRRKAVNIGLIIFFMLSFSVNVLNYIWHGMHYPNSLPCRQGYIYIFLLLTMCYEAYLHLPDFSTREINTAFAVAAGAILVMQKTVTQTEIHFAVYYASFAVIALYYFFLRWYKSGRADYNVLTIGLLLAVTLESALNMGITSVTITSRTSYTEDNKDVRTLVSDVQKSDPDFYRFEKITRKTKDDGAWMNFPSVSIFSSTAYADCSDFFKRIGCEASTNAYSITGSTPLVNMLFSVKYALYSEQPLHPEALGLSYTASSGETYLYKNEYSLPLGFMMTDRQLSSWMTDLGTPALVQNSLADAMETNPVLISELGNFNDTDYTFTASRDGEYYVYVNNKKIVQATAKFENAQKSFDHIDRGFFLELGYLYAGESVTVHSDTAGQKMDADAYYFDQSALAELYGKLSASGWKITEWKDDRLEGTIQAEEDGMMVTSIPYDKGWQVRVDGQKVRPEKTLDSMIGIPLTEGEHTILMQYIPSGIVIGALITALTFILLLLIYFLYERKKTGPYIMGAGTRGNLPEESWSSFGFDDEDAGDEDAGDEDAGYDGDGGKDGNDETGGHDEAGRTDEAGGSDLTDVNDGNAGTAEEPEDQLLLHPQEELRRYLKQLKMPVMQEMEMRTAAGELRGDEEEMQ